MLEIPNLCIRPPVTLGCETAVTYASWGETVTNQDLLNEFLNFQDDEVKNPQAFLEELGITFRYHPKNPVIFLENTKKMSEEMIKVGSIIGKKVMEANKWDKVDTVFAVTSTPPDQKGKWAKELAGNLGAEDVKERYLACDGAADAFLSACSINELEDNRVMIIAIEVLGNFIRKNNFKERATFSNGAAALAFKPKNFELINGKTKIEPDVLGVIRSPKTIPTILASETAPSWYELDEKSSKIFHYQNGNVYLDLPEPTEDKNHMEMQGKQTALFFARKAPPVTVEVLGEYYKENKTHIDLMVSHQPSVPVHNIFANQVNKLLGKRELPQIKIPWVLRDIGNVSSATFLVALTELVQSDNKEIQIYPGRLFNATSFGVGAAITSFNGNFKAV